MEDPLWHEYSTILDLRDGPPEGLTKYTSEKPSSEFADEALIIAAEKHMNDKRFSRAMEILDKVTAEYATSAHCQVIPPTPLGSPLPDQGTIFRYIRTHPNYSRDIALLNKSRCLKAIGKATEAINILEGYLVAYPEGRWSKQDVDLRKSLQNGTLCFFERTDEQIAIQLGKWHIERKDYKNAEKIFSHASNIYRHSHEEWRFYRLLASIHAATGNKDAEIKAMKEIKTLFSSGRVPLRMKIRVPEKWKEDFQDLDDISDDITLQEVESRLLELNNEQKSSSNPTPPSQEKVK